MCSFSNNRLVIVLLLVVDSRYEEQNAQFCKVTPAKNRIFYLHFRGIHCTLPYVGEGIGLVSKDWTIMFGKWRKRLIDGQMIKAEICNILGYSQTVHLSINQDSSAVVIVFAEICIIWNFSRVNLYAQMISMSRSSFELKVVGQ